MPVYQSLVSSRTKRSTAGNRMRALLDMEFEREEMFEEVEDDQDFVDKEEGAADEYASDFKDTDDEAEDEGVDAGEKQLQLEARQARKAARQKAQRQPGIWTTPKPPRHSPENRDRDSEHISKKRRISIPFVQLDEDTGEVVDNATRKSSRSATVQNKHELQSRLKDMEQRRAALPKRAKTTVRTKTQDELIRDALETEEQNIASLHTFLTEEEEKKKSARIKKIEVEGPLLRWVSRVEDVSVKEQVVREVRIPMIMEVEIPPHPIHRRPGSIESNGNSHAHQTNGNRLHSAQPNSNPSRGHTPNSSIPYYANKSAHSSSPLMRPLLDLPNSLPAVPSPITTTITSTIIKKVPQTHNYVIIESEFCDSPTFMEDMGNLFGHHVNWATLAILPRIRPTVRKVIICPITGYPAKYFEPRSGIPYADIRAFKTIEGLLKHQYVWSESLECYIGDEEQAKGVRGVPPGWEQAVSGKREEGSRGRERSLR